MKIVEVIAPMTFENLPIVLNSQEITIKELMKVYPLNGDHVISQLLRYLKNAESPYIQLDPVIPIDDGGIDFFIDVPNFSD